MYRPIQQLSQAQPATDGDGVALFRNALFNGRLDPFLMLDEIKAAPEDSVGAFPIHPHRGIQTLSYLINGAMGHRDSMGNASTVRAGGLQWMHTGQGIEHGEIPQVDDQGLWGFQFWLNVPRAEKYQAPRYQDVSAEHLPWCPLCTDKVLLKVVAGTVQLNQQAYDSVFRELSGTAALADVIWQDAESLEWHSSHSSAALYVLSGQVQLNEQTTVKPGQLVQLSNQNDLPLLIDGQSGSRVLIFSGEPIGEPIVHRGPFVMTTQQEIDQTLQAYRQGTLVPSTNHSV
ncbi:MAG: pirin family protein [Thiotrichales bacterium]|nr:pirin family protein [Thiotrichales bacterium]